MTMDAIHASAFIPIFVLAQNEIPNPLVGGLINGGALGLWVIYLIYRDKRESDKQDKRHEENLAAMKRIEDAYRTHTDLLIVGLAAMKTIDAGYLGLLDKLKDSNTTSKS